MRVFLAEPNVGIRRRVVEMITEIPGVKIAGEASQPDAAIDGIRTYHPDVVVMNLELLNGTALDVLDAIRDLSPVPCSILMMNFGDRGLARVCKVAGADYCLYQENRFEELCRLLRSMSANGARDS